jgi:hypothetical protein
MKRLRLVVVLALLLAMLTGCGAGISNKKSYDDLYANSAGPAKYTFDVPYKKVHVKELTCDTGFMAEALKAVYGDDIRFEHTLAAYTLDVEKLNYGKHATYENHSIARLDAYAEVTANGKTHRLTGEYEFKIDISGSDGYNRALCYGVMLDLAKKVKNITDTSAVPRHDLKMRDNKLHIY